jgi:hypothetical protein
MVAKLSFPPLLYGAASCMMNLLLLLPCIRAQSARLPVDIFSVRLVLKHNSIPGILSHVWSAYDCFLIQAAALSPYAAQAKQQQQQMQTSTMTWQQQQHRRLQMRWAPCWC